MSPELQAFYNAYATWLNNGAPETHNSMRMVTSTFTRNLGLCSNFDRYMMDHGIRSAEIHAAEMFEQLERESYPFGGPYIYNDEARTNVSHLNNDRRAWVHKHSQIPVKGEE
jgi:hypothetical protein